VALARQPLRQLQVQEAAAPPGKPAAAKDKRPRSPRDAEAVPTEAKRPRQVPPNKAAAAPPLVMPAGGERHRLPR
jgi:hypothetical protein